MHRRSLFAVALIFALAAVALAQQPALKIEWGPVISDVTPTSVRIGWKCSIPARARVLIDGREVRSPARVEFHNVLVEGLEPGRQHEYVVQAFAGTQRAQSDTYVFRTPPAGWALDEWSFIVFGDTRSLHDRHRAVVEAIMRAQPRPWLVLHTGDLVSDGRIKQHWDIFFDIERPILGTIPFYPCLGNHEHESEYYYGIFPVPPGGGPNGKAWYAFRFANALFVVLDTQLREYLDEQVRFLDRQLELAEQENIPWRFVSLHVPPISTSKRGINETLMKTVVPVVERRHATAVFAGHDHMYERSVRNGVTYIIAGGGGAPLYDPGVKPHPWVKCSDKSNSFVHVIIRGRTATVRAVRADDTLIEQFRWQAR